MKYSKTTMKELTARYRAVLKKCVMLNLIALGLFMSSTAMALTSREVITTDITGDTLSSVYANETTPSSTTAPADTNGGAIFNTATIDAITSDFHANIANNFGGAIDNSGTIGSITGTFDGNTANSATFGGGAIYNSGDIERSTSAFLNNTALNGGAIFNGGTMNDVAGSFSQNTAKTGGAGGAVFNYGTMTTSATYTSNGADTQGGAIYNKDGANLTLAHATVDNNTAKNGAGIANHGTLLLNAATAVKNNKNAESGGALFNTGEVRTQNAFFENNSSTWRGGALFNSEGGVANLYKATFTGNESKIGGAIYNDASTIDLQTSWFDSNKATTEGGAIYNTAGSVLNIGSVYMNNNEAEKGGAISTYSDVTIQGSDTFTAAFTANRSVGTYAEAGAIYSEAALNIDTALFESNTAGDASSSEAYAGAISAYGDTTISNTEFISNTATGDYTEGGAIYAEGKLTIADSSFEGNKSSSWAGAISAYGDTSITDTSFTNNRADSAGALSLSGTTTIEKATFTNNIATSQGGAINIYEGSTTVKDSSFDGNIAAQGGAIFNNEDASLTLEGKNTFLTKADTIYNNGIMINNGILTNNADIMTTDSGTFTNNGTIQNSAVISADIDNNSDLYSNKTIIGDVDNATGRLLLNAQADVQGKVTGGEVVFLSNTSTVADVDNVDISFNADQVLNGTITGTATNIQDVTVRNSLNIEDDTLTAKSVLLEDNATLEFDINTDITAGGKIESDVALGANTTLKTDVSHVILTNDAEKSYEFVDGTVTGAWTNTVGLENNIYDVAVNANQSQLDFTVKSTADLKADIGADANQSSALTALVTAGSSNGANEKFDDLAEDVNTKLQSIDDLDVKEALGTIEKMSADTTAFVPAHASSNVTQIFDVVGRRFDGVATASAETGKSGGDVAGNSGAVWAQGLYNKTKLSTAQGFDTNSDGLALGAESYLNTATKLGAGYAYTRTDIETSTRSTDADTHTAMIYGEYKPNNLYANLVGTYSWARYDENAGLKTAKYNVNSIGLQAMTGYDLTVKGAVITPEAGLRYLNVNQKSYTDTLGATVAGNKSDVLTGVVGVKASTSIKASEKITFTPELKLAATYDMINDDANALVTMANGASYVTTGEALDKFGVEAGISFKANVNDNIELSLGYEGKFRNDYTDQTGMLNIKYKF